MTCYLTVPSTSESRTDGRQTYRDVMQKTIETSLVFWDTKCRQQDVVVRDRRSLDILNSQQHLQEIHVHQLYANSSVLKGQGECLFSQNSRIHIELMRL